MLGAKSVPCVTPEAYLAAEEQSDVRHEYVGGFVYAMAGGTQEHNTICLNLAVALRQALQGGPCRVFMADVRVQFTIRGDEYDYYPDLIVTCDKRDTQPQFVLYPSLLIEVLSPRTERVDRREKLFAYQSIESLQEYVLVGTESKEVTLFRRANGWATERLADADASLSLDSLQVTLPLRDIYAGV